MKILLFSTAYLPFVGGAELALKEITDRLADKLGVHYVTLYRWERGQGALGMSMVDFLGLMEVLQTDADTFIGLVNRYRQKFCGCKTPTGRRCRYPAKVWRKHRGHWFLLCAYHEWEYRRLAFPQPTATLKKRGYGKLLRKIDTDVLSGEIKL